MIASNASLAKVVETYRKHNDALAVKYESAEDRLRRIRSELDVVLAMLAGLR